MIKKHGASGVSTNASGVSTGQVTHEACLKRIKADMKTAGAIDRNKLMGSVNENCQELDATEGTEADSL